MNKLKTTCVCRRHWQGPCLKFAARWKWLAAQLNLVGVVSSCKSMTQRRLLSVSTSPQPWMNGKTHTHGFSCQHTGSSGMDIYKLQRCHLPYRSRGSPPVALQSGLLGVGALEVKRQMLVWQLTVLQRPSTLSELVNDHAAPCHIRTFQCWRRVDLTLPKDIWDSSLEITISSNTHWCQSTRRTISDCGRERGQLVKQRGMTPSHSFFFSNNKDFPTHRWFYCGQKWK